MRARLSLVLLLAIAMSGCQNEELYSGLSEQQANEIVARLYSADLSARKIAGPAGRYRVETDRGSFSEAVEILQQHGLPRESFSSLGEIFSKDGFVSSPLEERARLNYALSQEISRTLSAIDGVIMARVHLAVPEREFMTDKLEASSASVFIKHRLDVDLGKSITKIKALVVNGFENLPYDNVTVSLFPAAAATATPAATTLQHARVPGVGNDSIASVALLALGALLLMLGVMFSMRARLFGRNAAPDKRS